MEGVFYKPTTFLGDGKLTIHEPHLAGQKLTKAQRVVVRKKIVGKAIKT